MIIANNIFENSLCSGCGVCSTVCPKNCIALAETNEGTIRPVIDESICVNCGKCKTVCPFEGGVKTYTSPMGNCYLGICNDFIDNASSGGVATYFMNSLLENGAVDYIVSVKSTGNSNELFKYAVCKTKQDLISAQGSAYYPVTLEKILKEIKNINGKCAVIGVPCFISALKKLKSSDDFWSEKIKYLIGIVCGHTPTKLMTDSLAFKSGHKREDIKFVRFRIKDSTRPAWDYGVKIDFTDNTSYKSFGSEDFGFLFWRRLFSQRACNYCSDVFANEADITFMDAWLPEYKEKSSGTSLVICRNPETETLLNPLIQCGRLEMTDLANAEKAQEKLVEYKKQANNHKREEYLRKKVYDAFCESNEKNDIIERIKRICYIEKLRNDKNPVWILLRIKDKVVNK